MRPKGDPDTYTQAFEHGTYRNLLAVLPGSDPDLKNQYVLVGAHYDHVGYGTRRNSRGPWGRIHNGADDNASGVSGVLEVAEAVALLDPAAQTFCPVRPVGRRGERNARLETLGCQPDGSAAGRRAGLQRGHDRPPAGRIPHTCLERSTACGLRRWASESNQLTGLLLDFSWEMKANSDQFSFVERGDSDVDGAYRTA